MENLLQGIPHVIVGMDDIHISRKDDNDHLSNLEAVVKRLSAAGLRLRHEKCFFMVPEVTYCGYVINGSAIKPVAAKVEAIQDDPSTQKCFSAACISGNAELLSPFPSRHSNSPGTTTQAAKTRDDMVLED